MMKRYDKENAQYMLDRGCFKDDVNDRILPARPKTNIPMENTTIKACYEACLNEGWRVAGLENGRSRSLNA